MRQDYRTNSLEWRFFMRWFILTVAASFPGIGLALLAADNPSPDKPTAFKAARIHTATVAPIDRGVLIIQKNKIVAVGAEHRVVIPEGAAIRDCSGKTIIPGP